MSKDLSGKTALVSGSTGGIGFAIAQHLAQSGATVVINGRTTERVQQSLKALITAYPDAQHTGIAADLSTKAGCDALIKELPKVDILVNNLGIFEAKPFVEIDDADWLRFFETNVLSGVRLSRHYLPALMTQGWGRIVFISSESAVNIPVEMVHYGMTKTAQLAVARGIAETAAGTGVTVNSVLPGPTRSDGVVDFFGKLAAAQGVSQDKMESDFIATHRPSSLIRRLATVDEVASMVAYVCSTQASAVNGAALRVEGGVVRSIL